MIIRFWYQILCCCKWDSLFGVIWSREFSVLFSCCVLHFEKEDSIDVNIFLKKEINLELIDMLCFWSLPSSYSLDVTRGLENYKTEFLKKRSPLTKNHNVLR